MYVYYIRCLVLLDIILCGETDTKGVKPKEVEFSGSVHAHRPSFTA
jgi:hypothetical protein